MKTLGSSLFILLWLGVSFAAGDEIQWLHSLDEAKRAAQETKRPILVHFDADWCGPCKRLDRIVFKDQKLVKAMNDSVIALKVNVDKQPDIADEFGVEALPMDVHLTSDGQLKSSHPSPRTSAAYEKAIQRLVSETEEPEVRVANVPEPPKLVFPPIRQPAERE